MLIDGKLYTLSERMKHYNVAGLSVAVIDNYQIVWANGYDYADDARPSVFLQLRGNLMLRPV
jgi:CubicO group peptidase (beta-lactamase class C family)